jgi:hypothetical protein
MSPRLTLTLLGTASFLVTLALSAWHDGLWERWAEPVAVAPTAPRPVPAPYPVVKADSPRAQPVVPDPVPAAMPVAAVMPVAAPTDDSGAVPADPTAPEVSERQRQERHGEAARGARTR